MIPWHPFIRLTRSIRVDAMPAMSGNSRGCESYGFRGEIRGDRVDLECALLPPTIEVWTDATPGGDLGMMKPSKRSVDH